MKSLASLIELQKFLHAFQSIERVVDVPERVAPENDVEHSYHLAMAGWFLAESFDDLNRELIIKYALVHDLVEVHAGDTYVYGDPDMLASKVDREEKALQQINHDWAKDFPELVQTIEEYETKSTEEALFVYALDKIMPIIVILNAEGKTWKDRGITLEQMRTSKLPKVGKSKHIAPYFDELLTMLEARPELFAKD